MLSAAFAVDNLEKKIDEILTRLTRLETVVEERTRRGLLLEINEIAQRVKDLEGK